MSDNKRPDRLREISRYLILAICALGALALAFGFIYFYHIYPTMRAGQLQPIPFSHRIHVGIKEIDCRFCHTTVAEGRHAGLPPVEKCLYCHEFIIPEHPWIRELQGFADRGEDLPWQKVFYLPDHVYFSHEQHIRGGISCDECHGQVQTMDRIVEANNLQMGFCIDCHTDQERATPILDCLNCHQ